MLDEARAALDGIRETVLAQPDWVQVVVVLVVALAAAKIVKTAGHHAMRRTPWMAKGGYDRIVVEELYLPTYGTVFLLGVYWVSDFLPEAGNVDFVVAATSLSLILFLWGRAVVRVGKRVARASEDTPAAREFTPIFKNVVTFTVVLISFFLLLSIWQVDITPLLASAGVIGIVLGIAARDAIGNFFGGISLYADRTYKVGDMIQLEDGERGTVVDMSIRSTTILTRDNIAITIPNAQMNSTQVINESAPVRRRRIRLNVGVAYGSDLDVVEESLIDVAEEDEVVLDSPNPTVRFREFGDSAIVAQLQCYIDHPASLGRARHRLIKAIDERFEEEAVKIPFPQRELTFFESGNRVEVVDSREMSEGIRGGRKDERGQHDEGDNGRQEGGEQHEERGGGRRDEGEQHDEEDNGRRDEG